MNDKKDAVDLIFKELEEISCYQIHPLELIEIAKKAGATFEFERSDRMKELMIESEKASVDLRKTMERLKQHTISIIKDKK